MTTTIAAHVVTRIDALEQSVLRLTEAFNHLHPDMMDAEFKSFDELNHRLQLSERETPADIPWEERTASETPTVNLPAMSIPLDLVHDAVIVLDDTGVVTLWNRSAERMLGWTSAEALGVPPMFLPATLHVGPIEPMTDSMTVCQCQDGQQILVRMSATYTSMGMILVLHEIPPAPPHETLIQADIANLNDPEILRTVTVGQLAAGVAHDVNNLISIIGGYSQIINEQMLPGDSARDLTSTITEMCHQAGDMLHYLTGRSKTSPALHQKILVDDLFSRLKRMIPRFVGVEHTACIECHTGSAEIRGEMIDLLRMVMNLVGNARSAMPGGGAIEVAASVEDLIRPLAGWPNLVPVGKYVMIVVNDQGKGMAPEVMSHLFDSHFTTRSQEGGTGIGMNVVSTIVAAAHGYIQVSSIPGHGTTVRVFFPVA